MKKYLIHRDIISSDLSALESTCRKVISQYATRDLLDGGKQSTINVFNINEPLLNVIASHVRTMLRQELELLPAEYELIGFVNENRKIAEDNLFHNHPEAEPNGYGGAFFVSCEGFGGDLQFTEPCSLVIAKPGRLVIFPWNYEHRVKRYEGPTRYSLGMNIIPHNIQETFYFEDEQ